MEWLIERVEQWGLGNTLLRLLGVVGAVITIVGLAGGGLVGVLLLLAILLLALLIVLAASLAALRGERESRRQDRSALRSLRQYVNTLGELQAVVTLQKEEISIARNGDATWHSTTSYRIEGDTPLHFTGFWMYGESPLTEREKRQVRFEFRRLPGEGLLPVDVEWESDRTARLWAHLEPVPPDAEVTIQIDFTWPRQLPKLGHGGVDEFEWEGERFPIERLEYTILLEPSHGRNRDLKYSLRGFVSEPEQTRAEGGAWRIHGEHENLQPGQSVVLRLDAS